MPACTVRLNSKTFPLTEEERRIYADSGIALVECELPEPGWPLSEAQRAESLAVVSAKVPAALIDSLPNLRVISRYGSGTDNIDVTRATERGIVVTNVPEFCLSE